MSHSTVELTDVSSYSTPQLLANVYISACHARSLARDEDFNASDDATLFAILAAGRPLDDALEQLAVGSLGAYAAACGPHAAALLENYALDHRDDAHTIYNMPRAEWAWYCAVVAGNEWQFYLPLDMFEPAHAKRPAVLPEVPVPIAV